MDSANHQTESRAQAQASTQTIALMGRRDQPTDGVQDYCERLAIGMAKQGWSLELARVPWAERGWLGSLRWLAREATQWNGRWVVLQYTALSWSRRAFPLGLLAVLWTLRRKGARCAIVFHDTPYSGHRAIDWLRRNLQLLVMRTAYRASERSVFNMALNTVTWLPPIHGKAVFIPVGANVSPPCDAPGKNPEPAASSPDRTIPTLAVFGVTGGAADRREETAAIVHAAREAAAQLGALRLLVLGRGALEAEAALRDGLAGTNVMLTVHGVLNSEEVGAQLAECDLLLFVRGPLSTRRGSGIAALACGLPIVAYANEETGFPLHEGGIAFVPQNNLAALADEVTRVLRDGNLRDSLRKRNEILYREWFSWDSIAQRFISSLSDD